MTLHADTSCPCSTKEAANHGPRADGLTVDILLMHYTGMESAMDALDLLCSEESGVSCHYLVHENGEIVQMVPEALRAWHAGKSSWQGESDTNSRSIGIEIVNPGHAHGYPEFPDAQIESVIALSKDILKRNAIPARNILAHSDVAPGRKCDPGEKFPWMRLYQEGIGHWVEPDDDVTPVFRPGDNGEEIASMRALLAAYGYGIDIHGDFDEFTYECVRAFQRHFRPSAVNGEGDAGTLKTLERLIRSL